MGIRVFQRFSMGILTAVLAAGFTSLAQASPLKCRLDFKDPGNVLPHDIEALLQARFEHDRAVRDRKEAIKSGSHYILRHSFEQRVSAIINGAYQSLVSERFPIGYLQQTAVVSGIQTRHTRANLNASAPATSNLHDQLAMRALDFVIETYRARRPHWTPAFLEKLKKTATEYLPESIYITIEDGIGWNEDRDILGTLRLIKERDGLIPMEKYLGIRVKVGNALKVEPGNFAITKSANAEAWPEIMMHLWSNLNRELEPGRAQHYLTYADKFSVSLYSLLGFTPVPLSKIELEPGTEMRDGTILKDGIEWTPMEASQETLDQLLDLHIRRLQTRSHDSDEINSLLSRRYDTNKKPNYSGRHHLGHGTFNGKPAEAFLRIETTRLGKTRLSLRGRSLDSNISLGMLDTKLLPLRDGQILPRPANGIGGTMTYRNGILFIENEDPNYESVTEIEISPDLEIVTSVRSHSSHPRQLNFNF